MWPPSSPPASLWLNYDRPVSAQYLSSNPWAPTLAIDTIVCPNSTVTEPAGRACQELSDGLAGLLGKRPQRSSTVVNVSSVILEYAPNSLHTPPTMAAWPPVPESEGFTIDSNSNSSTWRISASCGSGLLYGAFRFLNLLRRENATLFTGRPIGSAPATPIRAWNLWDNRDRTVERGYAGASVFHYELLPLMLPRYRDYARLLASVGINVIAWDNVNACGHDNEKILSARVITSMVPLVALFYDYGIRSFVVPCYSSPIKIGKLDTADPFDAGVASWWATTAASIASQWSAGNRSLAFGGFVIKADCEGEPGPGTYKRTELEGANAMADALAPLGALCIWRAFAHPPAGTDQAIYQFDLFKSWNAPNATRPNVALQVKSGPFDFQVREPPHSLFGYLSNVNLLIEFEATQEYLGQAHHVCHLSPQWSWYLNFETYARGPDSGDDTTIAAIVSGMYSRDHSQRFTGMAAVSNLGDEATWTHHPMSAADTYGFGRVAWTPTTDPSSLTREWVEATFGFGTLGQEELRGSAVATKAQLRNGSDAVATVMSIMMSSWEAYENYTASLGWGFVSAADHYHMDPAQRNSEYINASVHSIGFSRATAAGGNFASTYNPPQSTSLNDVDTCDESLLLAFHNVPYTHVLKGEKYGGLTVSEWINASHAVGAATARSYVAEWQSLSGSLGKDKFLASTLGLSFDDTTKLLIAGADDAATFSDVILGWLGGVLGVPA